jgi:PAP_fibrillin
MWLSSCIILVATAVSIEALKIAPSIVKTKSTRAQPLPTDRDRLIEAVSGLNYGIKATKADNQRIESLVEALVQSSGKKTIKFPADAFALDKGGRNKYQRSVFEGNWELQYTNGPDVLSIGKIPGVKLDYVGQTVDSVTNIITNQVKASGFLADTAQEVIVGVRQVTPTKVELDFIGQYLTISLQAYLQQRNLTTFRLQNLIYFLFYTFRMQGRK